MLCFCVRVLSVGAVLGLAGPVAFAQGFYVDGGFTSFSFDGGIDGNDTTENVHIRAGYQVNEYFGFEGELVHGVTEQDYSYIREPVGPVTGSFGLDHLVGGFAVVQLPVTERINLFARGGAVQGAFEWEITQLGVTDSGTVVADGFAFGVGTKLDLTEKLHLRADYSRHTIDSADSEAVSVGIGVKF